MAIPPPPGKSNCHSGSIKIGGYCGGNCEGTGAGMCCLYPTDQTDGTQKLVKHCGVSRLRTFNPFSPSTAPQRVQLQPKNNGQKDRKMRGQCEPGCGCNGNGNGGAMTYDDQGNPVYTSAPPMTRTPVCWAAAGATAVVGAGLTVLLTIAIANYSTLQPRKLTIQVADPANAGTDDVAALVNVDSVTSLGRNILGSAAGINAQSISSDADNGLIFGGSIPPISASNTIVVAVTNNGGIPLRVSAVVEGAAYQ